MGKLNPGELTCWTTQKMYSAVLKIKWEDVYGTLSWSDVSVRLGAGLSILISWLNTVFLSPPSLIPHSWTSAKETVASNSTISPDSSLDGRNKVQLISTKVLLNTDLHCPTSQISGEQISFHSSLFYSSPFHCPFWLLTLCDVRPKIKPQYYVLPWHLVKLGGS